MPFSRRKLEHEMESLGHLAELEIDGLYACARVLHRDDVFTPNGVDIIRNVLRVLNWTCIESLYIFI